MRLFAYSGEWRTFYDPFALQAPPPFEHSTAPSGHSRVLTRAFEWSPHRHKRQGKTENLLLTALGT